MTEVMKLLPSWSRHRLKLFPRPLSYRPIKPSPEALGRGRLAPELDLLISMLFITGGACILRPHMQGIPGHYDSISPLHTVYHHPA
jgi:hypothetical protein